MNQPPRIVEIIRRSDQGVTRPFVCRGDDGQTYWVKGHGAGTRALCSEWIGGRLAQQIGLPIPRFVLAEVPPEVIAYSDAPEANDLGAGVVFASEDVMGACELTFDRVRSVPQETRWRIILFDWWVRNADRTLGPRGGNVNLLHVPDTNSVHVIDHNMAFDPEFDPATFWKDHVFHADVGRIPPAWLQDTKGAMLAATGTLEGILEALPPAWTDVATLQPAFTFDTIKNAISHPEWPDAFLTGGAL